MMLASWLWKDLDTNARFPVALKFLKLLDFFTRLLVFDVETIAVNNHPKTIAVNNHPTVYNFRWAHKGLQKLHKLQEWTCYL